MTIIGAPKEKKYLSNSHIVSTPSYPKRRARWDAQSLPPWGLPPGSELIWKTALSLSYLKRISHLCLTGSQNHLKSNEGSGITHSLERCKL